MEKFSACEIYTLLNYLKKSTFVSCVFPMFLNSMKRFFILAALVFPFVIEACSSEDEEIEKESKAPTGAVDLGIVMTREDGSTYNLYWATSNLCKDGLCPNPEDYGNYYAWGETKLKYNFWEDTYEFYQGYSEPYSKYNNSDNKTVLETGPNGDDVASKILGGKWRMPTYEEWAALCTNCPKWTWTDNYNGTGVAGIILTSNVSGYKKKSVFLPAAGDKYGTVAITGEVGYYKSSSLNTANPRDACGVAISEGGIALHNNHSRYHGDSIRPVYED